MGGGEHTVVVYDDGLVLHFGHLHVVVRVVHAFVRLHVEHLCRMKKQVLWQIYLLVKFHCRYLNTGGQHSLCLSLVL